MARGRHLNLKVDPLPRQSSGKGAARDIELLRLLAGHGGPVRLADLFPGRFVPTWAVDAAARVDGSGFAVRLPGKAGYALTDAGRKFLSDLEGRGQHAD